MAFIITKYLLTAGIVVLVSELAKRSDQLGAFVAAMPTVTLLVLLWLFIENQPADKITNHAWYTFWYVVPTLPMFLAFPLLFDRIGFWWAMAACVLMTGVCFMMFSYVVKQFGVDLL